MAALSRAEVAEAIAEYRSEQDPECDGCALCDSDIAAADAALAEQELAWWLDEATERAVADYAADRLDRMARGL